MPTIIIIITKERNVFGFLFFNGSRHEKTLSQKKKKKLKTKNNKNYIFTPHHTHKTHTHFFFILLFPQLSFYIIFVHDVLLIYYYQVNRNMADQTKPPSSTAAMLESVKEQLAKRGYVLKDQLGKGAYAVVLRCVGPDGKTYAAKLVDLRPLRLKKRFDIQRLMREVQILQSLDHPNIVKLYRMIEYQDCVVLIMEYAAGRELFEYIISKGRLAEDEARPIFCQMLSAVQYLHKRRYAH